MITSSYQLADPLAFATLVVTAVGVSLTAVGLFRRRRKTYDGGARAHSLRGLLLDYVEHRARVTDVLRQAIRIDLNLTYTPAAVPVELRLVEESDSRRSKRSTEDTIAQIFKETGGGLLILGDPGTGKTNLLNELARDLVRKAREDPVHPIPVLLNLARWTVVERVRTLAEWIIDDLRDIYELTKRDAEALIRADAIIPLLDGLDEVDEMQRGRCVEAINDYQKGRSLGRFAVCCRWEEYSRLINIEADDSATLSPIKVRWAVRVERLSHADVEREVSQAGLEHVREILKADPTLRQFVDTPLWLHVLFLGSLEHPLARDTENPRDFLYDKYVSHVLKRRVDGAAQRHTDASNLLHWLGWLAKEMLRRHQTQFVLEDLAWSWIRRRSGVNTRAKTRRQAQLLPLAKKKRIRMHQRLIFGLGVGLVGGLAGGWTLGILAGVLGGSRLEGRIEAAEHLQFNWRRAISRWHYGLAYGGIFALAFGWLHGLLAAAGLWLFAAIFEIFQGGFQPQSGDGGLAPNRVTMRSLRYALGVTLAGGIFASVAIGCGQWAASNHLIGAAARDAITDGARWIAFGAFILGGEKGGWFAIRHYTVRAILWRQGVAPAGYVQFLNESVERLFLIRRGGTYEFIHVSFRDYMAARHGVDNVDIQQPKRQTRPKRAYHAAPAHMVLARIPSAAS